MAFMTAVTLMTAVSVLATPLRTAFVTAVAFGRAAGVALVTLSPSEGVGSVVPGGRRCVVVVCSLLGHGMAFPSCERGCCVGVSLIPH